VVAQPPGFLAVLGENKALPVKRRRALLRAAVGRRPGDLRLLMGLGSTYPINQRAGAEERVRWFQAAVAAYPRNVAAHIGLGVALRDQGDIGGAVAAFQEAIRLNPKFAPAHNNLGTALRDKGDRAGAVAAFQEAIRLDPTYARPHFNLGNALHSKGDLAGAVAAYREAIRLDPKDVHAHNNLGAALRHKGDLDGAVVALKEALRLDPKFALARNNLHSAERLRQLLPRLPDIAAGRSDPESPEEAAAFATLCGLPFQRRCVLAIRLYEKAFAADPRLAHDLATFHRYNAACCAALAAAGKAKDGDKLTPADRAALRGKALGWLRADLTLWQKQAASAKPAERTQAAAALSHWLRDTDLDGVRPGAARTGWTSDEAAAWDRFWAEVRTARDQATRFAPPAQDAPSPR
jgi:Flp pilus assembly protein TadD